MKSHLSVCWYMLVAVRLIWTLIPQTGYIHPDEFFQSVEVVAGDVFDLDVVRTWEFNSSSPVRSIVPLYLVFGVPLYLLRGLVGVFGTAFLTWYSVTVTVRSMVTILSLLVDWCVCQLCYKMKKDANLGLFVMSSSYVSLVYYTRTFSNTLEAFLFAALIYSATCEDSCRSYRSPKKRTSTSQQQNLRIYFIHSFLLPAVIVIGVFNRPTFIVFGIVPYLFWLFSGVSLKTDYVKIFQKGVKSVFTTGFLAVLFIVCDSVYFRSVVPEPGDIWVAVNANGLSSFVQSNLTVTPLNFLLYNMHSENLAEHGVHPRITHFLVNIPLLFGVLGIFFLLDLLSYIRLACQRQITTNFSMMLFLSCLVPTMLLSAFPHQEPRFLIPLLTPLVVLYAEKCSGSHSHLSLRILWILLNIVACIFYGIFHQGGVVRALGHIQQEQSCGIGRGPTDVIFWHTYMPPHHLLLQPSSNRCHGLEHEMHETFTVDKCVLNVRDFAGREIEDVVKYLHVLNSSTEHVVDRSIDVRLIAPGALRYRLTCAMTSAGFQLKLLTSFWPHFSSEDPPQIGSITCDKSVSCDLALNDCFVNNVLNRITASVSLDMYRVL